MKLKRVVGNINNFNSVAIEEEFMSKVDEVKTILIRDYDNLYTFVTNKYSKANPQFFKDAYITAVNNFVFVKKNEDKVVFSTPDLDNFDFSNLRLLQQILEGTSGIYVEISHEDLVALNILLDIQPINSSAPTYERVYLLPYTKEIEFKGKEVLKKKLFIFPFSNTPSLYDIVFGRADKFVSDNISSWIDNAITKSTNIIANKYKRI